MMVSPRPSRLAFGLAVALLALAGIGAAHADRLVLRDGSSLETKGPWEVQGQMVVFTLPNGTLSSLRLADVDLDASAERTVRAEAPAEVAEPEPQEAVLVLTDADVGHVRAESLPAWQRGEGEWGSPAEEGSPSPPSAAAGAQPTDSAEGGLAPEARLRVLNWDVDDSAGGLSISGFVINESNEVTTDITVNVTLTDVEGERVGSAYALLGAKILGPGQRTNFQVNFDTAAGYTDIEFETGHFALVTDQSGARAAEGSAPEAPEGG